MEFDSVKGFGYTFYASACFSRRLPLSCPSCCGSVGVGVGVFIGVFIGVRGVFR